MRDFDLELWKSRAWDRFRKAAQAGRSKKKIEAQWLTDVASSISINRLIEWCDKKRLRVRFTRKEGATYYPIAKTIVVSSGMLPSRQLMFLIHECGHHLIGMKEYNERYKMGYPQTDPQVTKTFHHRVSCLDEEMEAWHRGWKLTQRLGIPVDRKQFDKVRLECIKSYIEWSLDPKPKER